MPTIWFNRGLSTNLHVVQDIKQAQQPGDNFRIVCSHNQLTPLAEVSDHFELEPRALDESSYIDYCLDFSQRHQVDVFIPRHHIFAITCNQAAFQAAGIRLVLPTLDPQIFTVIKNKGQLYQALAGGPVLLPDYRVIDNLAEFDAACADLRLKHDPVCYKPTMGIGGRGFFILSESPIRSTWDNEVISIGMEEARQKLQSKSPFPQQMLMEYLPGPERSIDCLAHDGTMVSGIVRVKSFDGYDELLEDNPHLLELSRHLTEKLGLTGLFNVQFMEKNDRHYLLEINTRMSGGVHFCTFSGVCLPYWAIRLALGTASPSDVPRPLTNIRIERKTRTVLA